MQNERKISVDILVQILKSGAYNNISLRAALAAEVGLNAVQKAFITEMVNGVLRNLIYIDYIINSFSKLPVSKMKPFIACVIRCGAYQMLMMDKVPDFAACDEAVKMVKHRGFNNLSGFVNGVLRSIAKGGKDVPLPDKNKSAVDYLSVKYSHPKWIIEYFLIQYDIETVEEICAVNNLPPRISICVNTLKISRDELIKLLENEGVDVEASPDNNNLLYIKRVGDIAELTAFKEGLFHVMDESSMRAVLALSPSKGDTIIDMCAAPGGKSFYIAYLMGNTGEIYAHDIFEHKINLINGGAKRLGISNIKTQIQDAAVMNERFLTSADKVLVDVPCSGLGIIRKKPDIKYHKSMDDIIALSDIQRSILKTAALYVKPDGILVYSTCTLSKIENEDNARWFADNYPFELLSMETYLPKADGGDGFFVAIYKAVDILEHSRLSHVNLRHRT